MEKQVSRAELIRRAIAEYLQRYASPIEDKAFGLWAQRGEDGLVYQERLRGEWD
ncbi:ribbon-helix-helix protein, CopG family [Thiothrix eikelboomii]|uniref:ribbon-helix-helix protein, CopG family n=1 Tax=Thiothrix eikelboomii TaxID=92487 RepID=UPI00190EF846|nr:ribbon-helix-helix protein, CopG family [Thiothrix eikelboomii]